MSKIKTPDDCGDNKVIFRYDDPNFFVGYYAGETWNGWDCVRVDKPTFDQLRKICEEQGGDVEDYDNNVPPYIRFEWAFALLDAIY